MDQHTETRLGRRRLLTRDPMAELSFVIGEEAWRNPVGGPEVVRGQWQRPLELGRLRNVEVQVGPAASGFHVSLDGPFVLLGTEDFRRLGSVESQEVGCIIPLCGSAARGGRRSCRSRGGSGTPDRLRGADPVRRVLARQRRSMMVTLAWPPPSHMVWRP